MKRLYECPFKLMPFLVLFLIGCAQNYKFNHTVKVCDNKLYVEVFDVFPGTAKAHYLTDSVSFKLFVGEYDGDHENFSYRCEGDSLSILKIEAAAIPGGERRISNVRKFSIAELKKKGLK